MNMAKKKSDNSGLMSSAGLMRYFEADDTAIKLNPKMVVGVCVASGVVVLGLNIGFRLWRERKNTSKNGHIKLFTLIKSHHGHLFAPRRNDLGGSEGLKRVFAFLYTSFTQYLFSSIFKELGEASEFSSFYGFFSLCISPFVHAYSDLLLRHTLYSLLLGYKTSYQILLVPFQTDFSWK